MATKKLAKELGLLRQRSQSSGIKKLLSNQIFSYLIVIDFESTCWREKNNYAQEIIEFPAVVLNTSTGEIESEFHTYVQPQEHPILSEFCTGLTGITQVQVEAGIPLHICLSQFGRWLQSLQLEKGLVFPNRQQRSSVPSPSPKLCTFLTWSDWDLGVCLRYECKRKQIHKPDVLNSWIDLRSTYRLFYNRKPKGLNGALQDVGIQFSGREHSGVDDARNTAQLAARMMRDGCVMKITRSLERTPSTCPAYKKEKPNTDKEENTSTTNKPQSSKVPLEFPSLKSCANSKIKGLHFNTENSAQKSVQSLVSPKTLLVGAMASSWGHSSTGKRSITAEVATNVSSSVMPICPSPHSNNRFVMCSTTLDCFSLLPQHSQTSRPAEDHAKEEGTELAAETEDRCSSYDDVVLEVDDASIETEEEFDYVSEFDGRCYELEEPDNSFSPAGQITLLDVNTVSAERKSQRKDTSELSIMSHSTKGVKSNISVYNQLKNTGQHSVISEQEAYFAVPKTVIWSIKSNQQKSIAKTLLLHQEKPDVLHQNSEVNRLKSFVPEKTFTPNALFSKAAITHTTKHHGTPRPSFSIYTDSADPPSLNLSKNVLSSLSTNTLSSANRSSTTVALRGGGGKITSPLCECGRRAKRQLVSNGGPNHGRGFYCCAVRRSGSGSRIQKGCEFFKWESAVRKSSSVAPRAVGSSVSLCQPSSTLSCHPPLRSSIRKSY